MSAPYTRAELNDMSDETLIELSRQKSTRLYPWCLIGENIDVAKKRAAEYSSSIQLLVNNKDVCDMRLHISYYSCDVNQNNVITKIEPYFQFSV